MTLKNTAFSRSAFDIPQIPKGAELPEVIDLVNKFVFMYNFLNKQLSFQSNFDGYIAEDVVIEAGKSVNIEHFLSVTPKWRVILRQIGNGVVTDTPSEWNEKYISLKNNGSEDVTLSVFIARE